MSIRNRLSLVFALSTLLLIAVFTLTSIWVERLARNSLVLVERALPLNDAAHEMEINLHQTARALAIYASSGGATAERKARILDYLNDFEAYRETFQGYAVGQDEREVVDRLVAHFRAFVANASVLVRDTDGLNAGIAELRGFITETNGLLDEELAATIDLTSPANLKKITAALEMEINAAEIFEAIKGYLVLPNVASRQRFNKDIAEFGQHRAVFDTIPTSAAELAWLSRLDAVMASSVELGRNLTKWSDNVHHLLGVMQVDLGDIKNLLDNKLKPSVDRRVRELRERALSTQAEVVLIVVLAGIAAAAFAVGGGVYTTRKVVMPLKRLSESAAEIGRGRFSVTIPGEGDDEIGVLAATLRRMQDDLEATTVPRSHHYSILGTLFESVMIVSTDALIIFANQATLTLTGYAELDLIGLPLRNIVTAADLDISTQLQQKETFSSSQGLEATYRSKSGQEIPMLLSTTPLADETGAVESYIVAGVDNSIQHEALLALARSNEELKYFAYMASHDLQEPLRMVSSFTQLLQKKYGDKLDSEAQEYIHFAVDGAQRMREMLNDLLAYSRVGRTERPVVPVDCTMAIEAACANLEASIDETGAKITWENLPCVHGDARHLTSLFQNLISNSIKYRQEHRPEIAVSATRDGPEALIALKDNGLGIEERFLTKIFEPFQRLHSREKYAGTGIGLAICKRIVEWHGGRIWAESQPGIGTTVFFSLPANDGDQDG